MAIPATAVWEVRTTGNDANGGAFDSASGGTDYSQQDSAQATGTATSASTTVTATTGIFTSQMVGNAVTDGTTWVFIVGYTSSTIVTVDRAPSWTAASIKVGGALATVSKGVANAVASNIIWLKASGTYSISAALSLASGNAGAPTTLRGYSATRGDGVQATIQVSANAFVMLGGGTPYGGSNYTAYYDLILDGNNLATYCYAANVSYSIISNLTAKRFTTGGIQAGGQIVNCWATANYAGASAGFGAAQTGALFIDCVASALTCQGFSGGGANEIYVRCIAAANTGGSSDGFNQNYTYGARFVDCIAYANGRDGIRCTFLDSFDSGFIRGCLFVSNGGYGINSTAVTVIAGPWVDNNAFYNNTSGARAGFAAGAHDVALSGDPFVNSSAGNFALNNTAGAGASCRAAGLPGLMANGTTTAYRDLGAAQHADPAAIVYAAFNDSAGNDELTQISTDFPAGSVIDVYDAANPASPNSAHTGTILLTLTLPSSPWASAASKSMAAQNVTSWVGTAGASGTPVSARLRNAADTKRIDLTVAQVAGTGIHLVIPVIVSGTSYAISTLAATV